MDAISKFILGLIGLISLSALCCKAVFSSAAAQQHKKTVFLGYFIPHKVDKPINGMISVGFLQSARAFTLSTKLPAAASYRELLDLALKDELLLKVYVFDKSTEIARVQKAPDEMVRRYKKSVFKP